MGTSYIENVLEDIRGHIHLNCVNTTGYRCSRKGLVISDDKSLDFVKKNKDFMSLVNSGQVREITIDGTWKSCLRETEDNDGGNVMDFWNRLVTNAYLANHCLLVVNVEEMDVFKHCWHLKKLAKQENNMHLWPTHAPRFEYYSKDELMNFAQEMNDEYDYKFSADQLCDLIEGFKFDGYVLLVVKCGAWEDVSKFARNENYGEFEAMMCYYHYININ